VRVSDSVFSSSFWCFVRRGSARSRKAGHVSPSGVRKTASLAAMERCTSPPNPESDRCTMPLSLAGTISSGLLSQASRMMPGIVILMAIGNRSSHDVPGWEAILDAFKCRPEPREMREPHRFHRVVADPVQSKFGVDFRPEVVGKEAV